MKTILLADFEASSSDTVEFIGGVGNTEWTPGHRKARAVRWRTTASGGSDIVRVTFATPKDLSKADGIQLALNAYDETTARTLEDANRGFFSTWTSGQAGLVVFVDDASGATSILGNGGAEDAAPPPETILEPTYCYRSTYGGVIEPYRGDYAWAIGGSGLVPGVEPAHEGIARWNLTFVPGRIYTLTLYYYPDLATKTLEVYVNAGGGISDTVQYDKTVGGSGWTAWTIATFVANGTSGYVEIQGGIPSAPGIQWWGLDEISMGGFGDSYVGPTLCSLRAGQWERVYLPRSLFEGSGNWRSVRSIGVKIQPSSSVVLNAGVDAIWAVVHHTASIE